MRYRTGTSLLVGLGLALPALGFAAPALHCTLSQGNETQILTFEATRSPYTVPGIDFGSRFRFKAVVFEADNRIQYVKLYAYNRTSRQPVLLQQATYRTPSVQPAGSGLTLTGEQRLYAPPLGIELIYQCALTEARP